MTPVTPMTEKCGLCAPHTARDHSVFTLECQQAGCSCRRYIPERDLHRRTDEEKAAERAAASRPTAEEALAAHNREMEKLGPVERARRAYARMEEEAKSAAAQAEAKRRWPEYRSRILASVSQSDAREFLDALTGACAGDPSTLSKVTTVLEEFGLYHGGSWGHVFEQPR